MLTKGMYIADRYEVLDQVGAGGMSDVYKAKDHILGREVAIKILKQEFVEDVTFVTKFRSEAQSAAGLEHPNIVNIYDVGSENSLHYIVMEYVEGITLKTYIEKKGQLNYKEALSIAIQVGRGIEAAHNKNIVHRDIKPQNIIISTEGKVKVTDFGIARAATSNTIHADVMGSVHYASPEQARNGFVDFKSDIYSLGIVMYEMVTGRVPFDGDTTVSVALQHLQEEMVSPSAYAKDLPISLEKIILKATMKSPDRRYGSIEELLMDLKKALVSPNEDFVTIIEGGESDKTKVITKEEQEEIQQGIQNRIQEDELSQDEEEDPEEDEEGVVNPKLDKAIKIMAIAAAVVILAILVYIIGSVFGLFRFSSKDKDKEKKEEITSEQVTMIDLLGMTEEEAKAELKQLGLGFKVSETAASEEYEEGLIMKQSVASGEEVAANTTIKVTISTGEGDIEVPNVVGMEQQSAINSLTDKGFKYNRAYEYSNSVEEGKVISQNPGASSKAKKGDTITIVVSQGTQSVKVPSVVGKSQSQATNELSAAGLNVGNVTSEYSSSVPEGSVISQGVSEGKYVDAGSSVSLVISKGKEVEYFRLSNYVVRPYEDGTVKYVVLKDSTGKQIASWEIAAEMPISASDITTNSGTLYFYRDSAHTMADGSEAVSFTKQ